MSSKAHKTLLLVLGVHATAFYGIVLVGVAHPDLGERVFSRVAEMRQVSPQANSCYRTMVRYCESLDGNAPDGAVVFLGDSITQGLCTAAIAPMSINLGIGRDTTDGLLARARGYRSLGRAGAVILAVGLNDLGAGRGAERIGRSYRELFRCIPPAAGVVACAVLPVDERAASDKWRSVTNERISALNHELSGVCAERPGCVWVSQGLLADSNGNLPERYHVGDGIHLNPTGYQVWIEALKAGVAESSRLRPRDQGATP